jgi:CBS domain-containing protein
VRIPTTIPGLRVGQVQAALLAGGSPAKVKTSQNGFRMPMNRASRDKGKLVKWGELSMTTARDIMHPGCECLGVNETLTTAARRMAEMNVGALPVCGEDNRLKGIITDRDIVVKTIAKGRNPDQVRAGELVEGTHMYWIDANADVEEVLHQMMEHKIRRMPVLENKNLVGIISQADLAAKLPEDKVGEFVEAISARSH